MIDKDDVLDGWHPRGLDAAFAPGAPAWLFLAEQDARPMAVFQIVSVERGGETLWVEELFVTPEARARAASPSAPAQSG